MKRSHFAPVVLVLASAAALAAQEAQKPAAPPPAETPPTFPAQVEQVIVDVVITDKKGTPIRDLKQEDLTVTEDGVPQQIVSFEAVQVADQPSAVPPPPPAGHGQHHPRGAPRPHLRHPLRRHEHHPLEGQPGEGGGGELPGEGHPGGRPRHAHLERGRGLVDGPHGGGPAEARRHGEALRRPLHPRHLHGADVGLRGPAHPHLPRPPGGGSGSCGATRRTG